MSIETIGICKKNFSSPDVTRDCGHGKMDLLTLEDTTLAKVTLQPGWKWSEHIQPIAKTELCEVHHMQYVVSGQLKVLMDDGTEKDLLPGDFAIIAPGHDAWVVGDEPFVAIDFSPAMKDYASK
jgi:quercetin dioxygenase-like cupin family protein